MGDGRMVDKAIKFEEGPQPTRPRCMPTSDDPSDTWRERESSMVGVQRMRDALRTLPNGGHPGTDGTHDHDMGEILWTDLRSDFSRPPRLYRMGSDDMERECGQQPTMDRFANWIMKEELRQSTPEADFEMADREDDII